VTASVCSVSSESRDEPEVGNESESEEKTSGDRSELRGPTDAASRRELGEAEQILEGELASDEDRRVQVTGAFSGPLPPPVVLQEYDEVIPGLAREIVDQWESETAHRRETVEYLRETDRMAMRAFYEGERRGQYLSVLVFAGVIAVAIVAIVLHSPAIGIAAVVSGGASVVWAMRRRSIGDPGKAEPANLGDGDALEGRSQ
jgi:uncharacterized membrane protein